MTACKECGAQISTKATACPHCGAPVPKTDYNLIKALVIIFSGFVLVRCVANLGTTTTGSPPVVSEAACKKDLQCWSDRHKIDAVVRCTRAIEAKLRFSHEWTDGVMNPRFARIGWKDPLKGHMTFFGDQLRVQNGFGATQKAEYGCVYDPASGTVLQAVVELR
jgi:hypothetical protein